MVSQPQRATQISAPGKRLPRWPNTARERAMPGAPPRLPAIEIRPTIPYEITGAATATTSTCQMLSLLKITRPAPMVSSSTLMLAATQVGTSSRTRPPRSASGTGSRPRVSIAVSSADMQYSVGEGVGESLIIVDVPLKPQIEAYGLVGTSRVRVPGRLWPILGALWKSSSLP